MFRHILILPVLVAFLVGVVYLSSDRPQNLRELTTPKWENETAFLASLENQSGEYEENLGSPVFDNQVLAVIPPKVDSVSSQVLSYTTASDGSEKWIEVDISDFRLTAWEGNRKVLEFPVSTGRPGYNTVRGEFRVWRKVASQTYRGGSRERGDYYYLTNVPYSLFFHKGYAIHGAYWHNDFGIKNRSSGCVNLSPANAQAVYEWAAPSVPGGLKAVNATPDNPGVRIVVHD